MRSSSVSMTIVVFAATTFAAGPSGLLRSDQDSNRLPGARRVIDAANYASIQAAFDALPPEGGMVRIPPGVFEITEPLVLSRGEVRIEGAGPSSHIKNLNQYGKPALIVQHRDGAKVKRADRLWRVQLSNFRITGNERSGHGIEAIQIEEIFLEGITSSHHGGDGIRLDQCYEDPRVCNSLITYNKGTGLNLIGCHDIVVASNQFEENQDALRCTDGFNLCMTGNCVDDHLGHGVVIENTYGSVVSGNMIEECNGTAIVLDRDCYGITLSANVIAHEVSGGIELRDAHGCTVTGNTFTIVKANALLIGPGSSRITVTGNNFCDSYIGEGKIKRQKTDDAASGIVLSSTAEITVSGNLFSGLNPSAIALHGEPSRRVLVSNNLFVETRSDHERLQDSMVQGNLESEPVAR